MRGHRPSLACAASTVRPVAPADRISNMCNPCPRAGYPTEIQYFPEDTVKYNPRERAFASDRWQRPRRKPGYPA